MSGGSLDYVYLKVQDVADSLKSKERTPAQRAFAKHLDLVAEALRDIEWVLSGDYGKGDEEEAIKKVLNNKYPILTKDVLAEDIKDLIKELKKF